jgi:hypothetical protein
MRQRQLVSSVRRITHLSPEDRRLAIESAFELARASLEIRLRSSRVLDLLASANGTGNREAGPRPIDDAIRVGQIVDRMANQLPWHPSCLRRSLAVWRMLSRRGIPSQIHLGVSDPQSLEAHSWVTVGEKAVVGGGGLDRYVTLASFG